MTEGDEIEVEKLCVRREYFQRIIPACAPFQIGIIVYQEPPSPPLPKGSLGIRLERDYAFQLCLVASAKIPTGFMLADEQAMEINLSMKEDWTKHGDKYEELKRHLCRQSVEDNNFFFEAHSNGGKDYDCRVLSPLVTLMNHSCQPNSSFDWMTGKWYWRTKRAIEKGEELLLDYKYGIAHDKKKFDFKCCDISGPNPIPYERPKPMIDVPFEYAQKYILENAKMYATNYSQPSKKRTSTVPLLENANINTSNYPASLFQNYGMHSFPMPGVIDKSQKSKKPSNENSTQEIVNASDDFISRDRLDTTPESFVSQPKISRTQASFETSNLPATMPPFHPPSEESVSSPFPAADLQHNEQTDYSQHELQQDMQLEQATSESHEGMTEFQERMMKFQERMMEFQERMMKFQERMMEFEERMMKQSQERMMEFQERMMKEFQERMM